ncbi:hypothetical protein [Clavibacter zhangzhiyongii]
MVEVGDDAVVLVEVGGDPVGDVLAVEVDRGEEEGSPPDSLSTISVIV